MSSSDMIDAAMEQDALTVTRLINDIPERIRDVYTHGYAADDYHAHRVFGWRLGEAFRIAMNRLFDYMRHAHVCDMYSLSSGIAHGIEDRFNNTYSGNASRNPTSGNLTYHMVRCPACGFRSDCPICKAPYDHRRMAYPCAHDHEMVVREGQRPIKIELPCKVCGRPTVDILPCVAYYLPKKGRHQASDISMSGIATLVMESIAGYLKEYPATYPNQISIVLARIIRVMHESFIVEPDAPESPIDIAERILSGTEYAKRV